MITSQKQEIPDETATGTEQGTRHQEEIALLSMTLDHDIDLAKQKQRDAYRNAVLHPDLLQPRGVSVPVPEHVLSDAAPVIFKGPEVSQENIDNMVAMGFTREQAQAALVLEKDNMVITLHFQDVSKSSHVLIMTFD